LELSVPELFFAVGVLKEDGRQMAERFRVGARAEAAERLAVGTPFDELAYFVCRGGGRNS